VLKLKLQDALCGVWETVSIGTDMVRSESLAATKPWAFVTARPDVTVIHRAPLAGQSSLGGGET
jgi:hypothetical protein